ncbi:MAG: 3-phosphoshikimate 1-carboxyvinyltransferase [Candidatus Moranbacteria bacterium]|nr:3-phosphoshikimate 1-carboxyvinyltransferase [Candidatus Moranbacteria bacterium]
MKNVIIKKITPPIDQKIFLPPSKSITLRDYFIAGLTQGKSLIINPGSSDDCTGMKKALKKIGVGFKKSSQKGYKVFGKDVSLQKGQKKVFLGGSGVSARFLIALALLRKDWTILDGDQSLRKRPQHYLLNLIKKMGARVKARKKGFLPVEIKGGEIKENQVSMKGDLSSQYFSALILIAPLLPEGLKLKVIGDLVSKPYIDITVNEMKKFGVKVKNKDYQEFIIKPQKYKPTKVKVEGDASAASYFMALATVLGGKVVLKNLGSKSKQGDVNFYKICTQLGAKIIIKSDQIEIIQKKNQKLPALNNPVNLEAIPDTAQTLMAIAPLIPGKTKITGLQTLRIKECDRISAPATELKKLKVPVKEGKNWIEIGEKKDFSDIDLNKISINTYNDHRMAMSFAVLGAKIGNLKINNPDCVKKTFPGFWEVLAGFYV